MIRFSARLVILLVVVMAFSSSALAENRAGAVTLTPLVGIHVLDGALDLENQGFAGLGFGYNVDKNWSLELDGRYTPTEYDASRGSRDVGIYTIGAGLLYHFQPEDALNPYLGVGLGGIIYDFDKGGRGQDEDYMGYVNGGIKHVLTELLALRIDLRYMLNPKTQADFASDSGDEREWRHHFQAMLGLAFQFGGTSSTPVKAVPAAEAWPEQRSEEVPVEVQAPALVETQNQSPLDSDKDGVLDAHDECPGTAAGVRVGFSGCPLDSDNDGIADSYDECPGTTAGVKVGVNGCPPDSDKDGIADSEDICPNTRAGLAVDRKGCPPPIEQNVKINLNILFASGKTKIANRYTADINKLGEFMNTYPGTTTTIEGYTDSTGSAALNKKLSQRRADAVRTYLIKKYQIAPARIKAVGHGPKNPVADNATAAGRRQNRRIEAAIETTVFKPR
ncbi:MAG: OmpA family protein [Desulfuromonadales bacterium]|nr:OmpA family protein [Desulfuromonadales bacterium]